MTLFKPDQANDDPLLLGRIVRFLRARKVTFVPSSGLSATIGLILLSAELGGSLHRLSYDLPFLFRSNVSPDEAIIVYVDEPSRKELGQPSDKSAWDHGLYARLVDRLRAAGARTFVFDIIFNEKVQENGATQRLAESIREHGNVVLAAELVTGSGPNPTQTLMSPDPLQEGAAAAVGLVSVEPDPDSGLRKIALAGVGFHHETSRSIAAVAAQRHLHDPKEFPADIHLNYYGPPYGAPAFRSPTHCRTTTSRRMLMTSWCSSSLVPPRAFWTKRRTLSEPPTPG